MNQTVELAPFEQSAPAVAPRLDITPAWIAGLLFGMATQFLFLYTVIFLFLFLRYGGSSRHESWFWVDLTLAVFFAVPHSLLLAPPTQQFLKRKLPSGLMGCVHCTVTCISLLILFHFWRSSTQVLWRSDGALKNLILGCFYGSWVALLYSLWLTGAGYQTGLTQWWYWLQRKQLPRRSLCTTGAFRWMRHPVYMSFLGLIWFTPTMTADHAVLTATWTLYIYLGSFFKDKRLLKFIGKEYHEYGKKVTGLPLIGVGSLRRFK